MAECAKTPCFLLHSADDELVCCFLHCSFVVDVTDLPRTELTHRVCIHYKGSLGNVINLMQDICSDVEKISDVEIFFFHCLRIRKEETTLIIEVGVAASEGNGN